MPAYAIADVIEVMDSQLMDTYAAGARAAVQSRGGKYLVATPDAEILEVGSRPGRIVMVGFDDMGTLKNWYNSTDYQRLIKIRQAASENNLIAVGGA